MKPAPAQAPADVDLLYPLSLFCENAGHPLPSYEAIEGAEVPEPYRGLLVHRGDMTSRLEAFHGGSIVLEVLHREHTPDAYRREVVLRINDGGLPVEYGAIEICLEAFPEEVRKLIVEAHLPLGGLMNRHRLKYRSEPRAFIRLGPDPVHAPHLQYTLRARVLRAQQCPPRRRGRNPRPHRRSLASRGSPDKTRHENSPIQHGILPLSSGASRAHHPVQVVGAFLPFFAEDASRSAQDSTRIVFHAKPISPREP